jgi:hypothetical protein
VSAVLERTRKRARKTALLTALGRRSFTIKGPADVRQTCAQRTEDPRRLETISQSKTICSLMNNPPKPQGKFEASLRVTRNMTEVTEKMSDMKVVDEGGT